MTRSPVSPIVEFRNVSTVIDQAAILQSVSFTLSPGRLNALVGPSGCGKTTLLRHLVGLSRPSRGTVLVDGRDVVAMKSRERTAFRRATSATLGGTTLFEGSLYSSATVFDNATHRLRMAGLPEAQIVRHTVRMLQAFGLGESLYALPAALSAHAKRRLALAGALLAPASLLIIDDLDLCTDRAYRASVVDAVRARHRASRPTVLITTHDLNLAELLADELVILSAGRLNSFGRPHEVLALPVEASRREHAEP